MRFKTSQTTPPHLDRRLQLRMLSFVGLIAIIMFTLSAMNNRPAARNSDSQRQASASPDSLTFEVRREVRDLKDGEFIVPRLEEDGPRGQSPRSRTATAVQERELFTPRSKERSRDGGADDRLFPRRKPAPKDVERLPSDGDLRTIDDPLVNDNRDDDLPPATRPMRVGSVEPPPVDDEWSSTSDSDIGTYENERTLDGESEGLRRPAGPGAPVRREPLSFDQPTLRSDDIANPIDDSREPFRPNHFGVAGDTSPRQDIDAIENHDVQIITPDIRRSREMTPRKKIGTARDSIDDDTSRDPVDLRRRGDLWQSPSQDGEPLYDEIATVRIDKRYLDVVKDNTLGILRDESDVFYRLLDHARRVPSATLERAGEREVQYINLMTEPDRFRGEPITIEGDLWRLYEFEAGQNRYGVNRVYEGWVFTGDSSNHPYRIICTSLPKGIEPGENLRKPVRITGYFFKREGYPSQGGVHVAPTLLARRIGINPMPNGIPLTAGIVPYMTGAIMAVGLALLVTIVSFAISDERSTRSGLQRLRRQPQMSFAGLEITPAIPVEESLRQLAERQRELAVSGAYGPLFSRQAAREHAAHDYSTSRQVLIDEDRRQHRKQTGVLQNWSARQQAAQAEIDALRSANARPSSEQSIAVDELSSDNLDPARNILLKPATCKQSVSAPSPSTHAAPPSGSNRLLGPRVMPTSIAISPSPVPQEALAEAPLAVTHSHQDIAPLHPQTNIAYGASKLSEWEDEIAKMANRGPLSDDRIAFDRADRDSVVYSLSTSTTVDRHERDRLERERDEYDRLERERMEREHHERELIEHERVERERTRTHREFERSIDPANLPSAGTVSADGNVESTNTHSAGEGPHSSGTRRGGWGWPRRKKNAESTEVTLTDATDESGIPLSDETADDATSGDVSGDNSSSTGWGRSRKRSRNWRNGDST